MVGDFVVGARVVGLEVGAVGAVGAVGEVGEFVGDEVVGE